MKKLRVLVSAFAFDPREPACIAYSAGYTGWKLVEQISRFSDICVVTTQEHRDPILEALSDGALSGVPIHFFNVPSGCRQPKLSRYGKYRCARIWNRRASEYAKKLHSEKKFDAAHHLSLGPSWLPNLLGTSLALPFIWGPLGGDADWLKSLRKHDTRKHLVQKIWERTTFRMGRYSSLRIKCAESAKAILIRNPEMVFSFPGVERRKIHVFPAYGLESVPDVSGEKTTARQNRFTMISAGSFSLENGFALAVEAFLLFNTKFPNSEYTLFGDGLEQKHLEGILHNGIVRERIRIHSPIEKAEMRERLRDCDVFVNLSLREEADVWLIEAMAAGLPVVSLSSGGPGFLIQDNWGIKVKLGSREQMVRSITEALEKLYSGVRQRKKMARAAIKNAANYTWDRLGKKLQGIYGEAFLQEEDVRFSRKGKERFFY